MALVVQIVLAVILLLALVAVVLSSKNWHWSMVTVVVLILLAGTGALFLGAEVYRVHRNLRAGLPKLEKRVVDAEQRTVDLLKGVGDQPGTRELDHQLKIVTRQRGRVWRGVLPAGEVDNQGRVETEIPNPKPHGLAKDTIVFAFETGEPNGANPADCPQYLGEFRVVETKANGVVLESVLLIDQRTGERLAASQGPWSLYETMPTDKHAIYADLSEEQLRNMLPEASVEEYVRHGTEATADDDQWHVIGLDENDQRVGPEQIDQAVKRLYDRPLRDYAFLFEEYAREKVVALAARAAVIEDNAKLEAALESAKQLAKFREAEKVSLTSDLEGLLKDRTAAEAHRDAVQGQLTKVQQRIDQLLADNSTLAKTLTRRHNQLREQIDRTAPAPEGLNSLLSP